MRNIYLIARGTVSEMAQSILLKLWGIKQYLKISVFPLRISFRSNSGFDISNCLNCPSALLTLN